MPPDYNYGLQVSLHSLVAVEKNPQRSGPLPQSIGSSVCHGLPSTCKTLGQNVQRMNLMR